MKKSLLAALLLGVMPAAFAQNGTTLQYYKLIRTADSLYNSKNYKASAFSYSEAFKANHGTGFAGDRYNAACSWALAGYIDSAFSNLDNITKNGSYTNYNHIRVDPDLNGLHTDQRWKAVLASVKAYQERAEAGYNKPIARQLDSIGIADQAGRLKIDSVQKKYGMQSKQMDQLWKSIILSDSLNLEKVKAILDKYGWLGTDKVGLAGNKTLFLVIQHADAQTRDKYLPMMRQAVKQGRASAADLALMEDRSALEHGKKQIYGSQIGWDKQSKKYYVSPIEDEGNVDTRRNAVGLEPLAVYALHWGIVYRGAQKE